MIDLLSFSDNDNYLEDLTTEGPDLIMTIRTWENSLQSVRFVNYRGLKDKQSSGVNRIYDLYRVVFIICENRFHQLRRHVDDPADPG